MQNPKFLKGSFCKNKKSCQALNSLYEVEHFLRKLSCAKNSICFVKSAKNLIRKNQKI